MAQEIALKVTIEEAFLIEGALLTEAMNSKEAGDDRDYEYVIRLRDKLHEQRLKRDVN